jgi:peptide/nickel transport system ATP-binding protein
MGLKPLLSLFLTSEYPGKGRVLNGVSLDLYPGEILGLVGQSGSGKSTMALSILRLLSFKGGSDSGSILFRDTDLMKASEKDMRKLRGKEISLVMQSPLASLNPSMTVGNQLQEAWRAHSKADGTQVIMETLRQVSLPVDEAFLKRYPRQLSVGLAQRILIAMAVLHRPALLLADEPTSALDALTQAEILELFGRLNREYETAMLYVSHDLLSVASLCHRIAILHEGNIVEQGQPQKIFENPQHEYTRKLVNAVPTLKFKSPELVRV